MTGRHRAGFALAITVALALGTGINAGPAGAAYGFLGHYEVCSRDGAYAWIASLSVRENVFVAEQRDDVIRVLTQGGEHVTTSIGTGRPGEFFRDPIVGTSPNGALYVINNPMFNPRLFKFFGRGLERELAQSGAYSEEPLHVPTGVFGTRPGGRGAAAGEVFVADATLTNHPAIKVYEADGKFSELFTLPSAVTAGGPSFGAPVSISGVRNFVLAALGNKVVLLVSEKPLRYISQFGVVGYLLGVAGAPDDSWWVLGGRSPGFAGLEHHGTTGELIERVPIDGLLYALAVAPDGAVWVARDDGLLRIGPNGVAVPPSQYLRGKCGPPQVRTSVPKNQQIIRTRKLLVVGSCNEQCSLRASGRLFVPGRGSPVFKLRPAKRQVAAGRRARLRLRLSRKAAAALRRAKARGRRSSVQVTVAATDGGKTKSIRQFGLKIGR